MSKTLDSQLNLSFSHADLVLTTSAPSGVNPFSARSAAEKDRFFDSTPEYYSWRILLQVVDMQLQDYNEATNGDREEWKSRILDTLQRISTLAGKFKPSRFPSDIKPATAASAVLSASGANWCDVMTASLSVIFLNVPTADTLKIELFPTDTLPQQRNVGRVSVHNLPALLETGNT